MKFWRPAKPRRPEGVRIHHASGPTGPLTNCVLQVPHPGDPDHRLPGMVVSSPRKPKFYFLRLDGDGNVLVSDEVWRQVQKIMGAGSKHRFLLLNTVSEPPPIRVGWIEPELRRHFVEEGGTTREVEPPHTKVDHRPLSR